MDCYAYRNAIATDPSYGGGEAHVSQCTACQAYRDDVRNLERRIEKALALSVPALEMPELADIDSDTVVSLVSRRGFRTPIRLAFAATVVLVTFVGIRLLGGNVTFDSLEDEILAHLDHEPYALRVTDKPVRSRKLQRVVPETVAVMNHDAGLITYAQTCVINGKKVPHLVIQGRRGPVTILLMPDETIESAVDIQGESVNGVILPVGSGSIAIIGEGGEDLDKIQQNLLNSVAWSA